MAGLSKDAGLERVVLSGGPLRIDEVVGVARGRAAVELSDAGRKRMTASREVVERLVTEGKRAYGVSTGFGLLANTPIAPSDLRELQRRIVLSHATGSGDPLETEVVRAMQVLRARTLVQGYSGVRPVVVEALLALLDAGVTPVIPEHGSVGASGDLAQLAHLALPLIGEGEVQVDGQRLPAIEGLRRAGLEPLELSYKEGLSLVNGTEGLLGTDRPFQRRLHELRPHPGQLASADNLRELLAGSPILASHRHSDHAIQDAYSLRRAPRASRRLRAPGRPPPRPGPEPRPPPLPDRGPRAQLRADAHPVHGRRPGERVQGPRAPGVGRLDPHLRQPGGPRVDGLDSRPQAAEGAGQRAPDDRHRGALRRPGRGHAVAAAARPGRGGRDGTVATRRAPPGARSLPGARHGRGRAPRGER